MRGGNEELMMRQCSSKHTLARFRDGTVCSGRYHGGGGRDRVFWKRPLYVWRHKSSSHFACGLTPTPDGGENGAALTDPTLGQKPSPMWTNAMIFTYTPAWLVGSVHSNQQPRWGEGEGSVEGRGVVIGFRMSKAGLNPTLSSDRLPRDCLLKLFQGS